MSDYTKIRDYWEKIALSNNSNDYKDHWLKSDGTPVNAQMYAEVARFVSRYTNNVNAEILEIGCGTGRILSEVMSHGYNSVTGIDFSAAQIDICKQRELNCNLWVGDLFDFRREFSSKRFDLIFLHSVTQYFPSAEYFEKFLTSALETLQPRGKILLIDVPISWYKDEMIASTPKDKIVKVIKDIVPSYFIEKVKSFRSVKYVKERIGDVYIEYEAFNGFYVEPIVIENICGAYDKQVEMIYQPFSEKPMIYKKFRPIFVISDASTENV